MLFSCPHPTPPLCNKGVSGRLSESPQCFHWPTITQCFAKRAQSNICLGPQLIFDLDDLSIFCHRLVTNYLLPIVYFHSSTHAYMKSNVTGATKKHSPKFRYKCKGGYTSQSSTNLGANLETLINVYHF